MTRGEGDLFWLVRINTVPVHDKDVDVTFTFLIRSNYCRTCNSVSGYRHKNVFEQWANCRCGRRIPKYLRMEMHKPVISNRTNPIIDFSE